MLKIFVLILVFVCVCCHECMWLDHIWEDSSLVLYFTVRNRPQVEYCRFVRSDGLGFTSKNVPTQYIVQLNGSDFTCALTILHPKSDDAERSWTVFAKVFGEDEELSMTTTWNIIYEEESEPHLRGLPRPVAILLLSTFSTLFVVLVILSLLPNKNREWMYRRAGIRMKSQAQPQQQNHVIDVPDLPKPVHTEILTDLPRKV